MLQSILTVSELKELFNAQDKNYYNEALKEIDSDGDKKIDVLEFVKGVISWQNASVMTVNESITELKDTLEALSL